MEYEVRLARYNQGTSDKVYLVALPILPIGKGVDLISAAFTFWGRSGNPSSLQFKQHGDADEATGKFGEKLRKGYQRQDGIPAHYLAEICRLLSKHGGGRYSSHDGDRVYIGDIQVNPAPMAPAPAPVTWDHGDW